MSRRGDVAGTAAVLAAAALAAGCGSAGPGAATTTHGALRSTSTATAMAARPHHARHRPRQRHDGYGRIPSWLPSARPPSQTPLKASLAHPRLTLEGESLAVTLGATHLLVTAVGPRVPEIGHTPVPETSPVTFVVTFARVSAPIALDRSSFVLVDEQHRIHHPRVTGVDGRAAPAELRPGPPVSIELHAVLPTGDGGLEWRPAGPRAVAGWDFNVEID